MAFRAKSIAAKPMAQTALILEDSKTQAQIIAKMIEAQGWATVHCDNVREAIDSLKLLDIHALFLDVFVGQHNTMLHVEQFRRLAKSAPILLMSAGSSQDSVEDVLRQARRAGADYVLRKPFSELLIKDIFAGFNTSGTRRRHILIIDDSAVVRRFGRDALASKAYRISEATSMEEAFSNVNIAHVDLVLCDVFMPGMGGLKGMRTLKTTWPEVKIVAMSAGLDNVSERDVLNATRRIGADAQIAKPFTPDDLIHIVEALLEGETEALASRV